MIFFYGKARDLKPALERYFSDGGKKNINEMPFWFGVCKTDQFDMIDLAGQPVLNAADAMPVRQPNKKLTVLQELKLSGKNFWRRFRI